MKYKGYSFKRALGALAIGAVILLGASEMTYAQGRYQRDFRRQQRWERNYYGYGRTLRNPQWRGRYGYYNNRYYYNRPFNRGYYNYRPYNRGYFGRGLGLGFGFGLGRRRW